MQRAVKRASASAVAAAAFAGGLALLSAPAFAVGIDAGPADIVPSSGTSANTFTIALPAGASCTGDSANSGYNVTSYMVPVTTEPSTLQFLPLEGPIGTGFSQPLWITGTGEPYVGQQTANADAPNGPGKIINIPQFSFGDVYGPGQIPAGSYNVGIACIKGAPSATQLDKFWNTKLTVTTDPAGGPAQISWYEGLPPVVVPKTPVADFDGNGVSDLTVYRPSQGSWITFGGASVPFGTAGDIPVPGDYDGDEDADRAVFRPSQARFYIQGSPSIQLGTAGDVPVPADYDGDGADEVAVYRPSSGRWYIDGVAGSTQLGTTGDVAVPGDYDGDGDDDIAVYRPSQGRWFVNGVAGSVQLGSTGDVPVPADYDGDGDDDRAVFRPTNGSWYLQGQSTIQLGSNGDVPVPGNWTGGAGDDVAVYRPSKGLWFVEGGASLSWGTAGDIPVGRRPLGST